MVDQTVRTPHEPARRQARLRDRAQPARRVASSTRGFVDPLRGGLIAERLAGGLRVADVRGEGQPAGTVESTGVQNDSGGFPPAPVLVAAAYPQQPSTSSGVSASWRRTAVHGRSLALRDGAAPGQGQPVDAPSPQATEATRAAGLGAQWGLSLEAAVGRAAPHVNLVGRLGRPLRGAEVAAGGHPRHGVSPFGGRFRVSGSGCAVAISSSRVRERDARRSGGQGLVTMVARAVA